MSRRDPNDGRPSSFRGARTFEILLILSAGILIFLAGCAAASTPAPPTASPQPSSVVTTPTVAGTPSSTGSPGPTRPAATPTLAASLTPTRAVTSSPQATSQPTAASSPTPLALPTRLPAKNWKEWPVTPEITNRAREIYQQGLLLGTNPHAFSKVGDCQGIKEVWLGVYDQPALYTLSPENASLKDTIDWFQGSFNRNGYAVMGGYNARAVLQPGVADPAFCQAGESPVACENRRQRPSLVLVSLEFYYDGRTPENYTQYLRQVIEFYSARGVVPILATKADNMEGDDSLNQATAALALEYDLPLWNFWRAVQPLPNHGMDATRPDGFHISVDAWRVRSFTALEALDAIWRGVRSLDPGYPARTQSAAQTPTPQAAPRPSKTLVFDLAEREGELLKSRGVYLLDTQTQNLTRLFDERFRLQSLSPDGSQLLVNQAGDLYLAALGSETPRQLTAGFEPGDQTGAIWLPGGRTIALIADRGDGLALWLATPDGSAWRRLYPSTPSEKNGANLPAELIASPDPARVYWLARDGSAWFSALDGSPAQPMNGLLRPELSPDGSGLAYAYLTEKDKTGLALTTLDRRQVWTPLPEGYFIDASWSPSGRWLAALWMERSDYSGKPMAQKVYLLSPADSQKSEFDTAINLSGQLRWSPDGRWLLVTGTETNAEGYRVNLRLVAISGGAVTVLDGKIPTSSKNFIFIHNLYWLP